MQTKRMSRSKHEESKECRAKAVATMPRSRSVCKASVSNVSSCVFRLLPFFTVLCVSFLFLFFFPCLLPFICGLCFALFTSLRLCVPSAHFCCQFDRLGCLRCVQPMSWISLSVSTIRCSLQRDAALEARHRDADSRISPESGFARLLGRVRSAEGFQAVLTSVEHLQWTVKAYVCVSFGRKYVDSFFRTTLVLTHHMRVTEDEHAHLSMFGEKGR